jgi:hypothetical protein
MRRDTRLLTKTFQAYQDGLITRGYLSLRITILLKDDFLELLLF